MSMKKGVVLLSILMALALALAQPAAAHVVWVKATGGGIITNGANNAFFGFVVKDDEKDPLGAKGELQFTDFDGTSFHAEITRTLCYGGNPNWLAFEAERDDTGAMVYVYVEDNKGTTGLDKFMLYYTYDYNAICYSGSGYEVSGDIMIDAKYKD